MSLKNNWLGLAEYSTKYRVSVSTLRRRIKRDAIRYQLMEGKYYIIDEPMDNQESHRSSPNNFYEQNIENDIGLDQTDTCQSLRESVIHQQPLTHSRQEGSDDLINTLIAELKKAYMQVLQEKEQHILLLKEEISDLRTLTGVLENENKRLQDKCSYFFESTNINSVE